MSGIDQYVMKRDAHFLTALPHYTAERVCSGVAVGWGVVA